MLLQGLFKIFWHLGFFGSSSGAGSGCSHEKWLRKHQRWHQQDFAGQTKIIPVAMCSYHCMIEFVAYMSKQYGDNPFLGEEFMNTVVDSQWSKTTLRPFVKVALTLTNCTATKLVDGVAKLITKTDIPSLKAKKFEHGLNEIESSLGFPWATLKEMPALDHYGKFKLFSNYCIRYSLLITNKQKQGGEGKGHSMEEIKAQGNDGE